MIWLPVEPIQVWSFASGEPPALGERLPNRGLTSLLSSCLNSTAKRTRTLNQMINVIHAAAFMNTYSSRVHTYIATSAPLPPQTMTCRSRAPATKRPSAAPLARAWTQRMERRRRKSKGRRKKRRLRGRRKPVNLWMIQRRRPKREDLAS